MTEHRCKTLTPGCYRCDLNKDELIEHQSERINELELENKQLRADLRCALRLLGEAWSEGAGDASWGRETFALMELHKETDQ